MPATSNAGDATKILMDLWESRCRRSLIAHYQTAVMYERQHWRMGWFAVALNAIVSSAAFSTLSDPVNEDWIKIFAGCLGMFAAIVVAIQNFLQFGERAEKHRQIATRFSELKRKIELNRAMNFPDVEIFLQDFDEKYCQLIKDSPTANEDLYQKARRDELQNGGNSQGGAEPAGVDASLGDKPAGVPGDIHA